MYRVRHIDSGSCYTVKAVLYPTYRCKLLDPALDSSSVWKPMAFLTCIKSITILEISELHSEMARSCVVYCLDPESQDKLKHR
jgi:hypothetical protein